VTRKLAACRRAAALWLAAAVWCAGATAPVDAGRYLENIKYLASTELRGRATGSPELDRAAEFIAARFRAFGLAPAVGKDYLQPFSVTINARLGEDNRFAWYVDGRRTEIKAREDFIPFNFSSSGAMEGPLVFAGYGITAPEYDYDDYASIDAKGKIVLILRHEPQEFDDKSVFAGRAYTERAQFASKALNAVRHGARGIILVADRASHPGSGDQLETFLSSVGPGEAGVPFVQVKASIADHWFAAAGRKLDEVQEQIDADLKPRSFAFPASVRVEARVDVEHEPKRVYNVAGYLPGESAEYVVVGAHYDHLGLGEQFSMAPAAAGKVHPGADDNASGVSGVIELARWFAARPKMKRGILFLAFAGEEIGLLGSSFYVNNPVLPIENAAAMINLDMIGRVRDGKVYIGGAGTGTTLQALLDGVAPRHDLRPDYSETNGYGSSDHVSFITRQVPVLFFFSGLHPEYHQPADTWETIEAEGAARLLSLAADVVEALCSASERPRFVKPGADGPRR
jgi:aminopeptidase YwaD